MAQKPKPESSGFELKIDKQQESFAWSTEKVNQLMLAIEDGYKPSGTPFHEGNPNLRKGNIVFNYTQEEIRELRNCASDIVYFANNYCTVMTERGLETIKLRPYQEDMLRQFYDERFSICLAARQVGKCLLSSTKIKILIDDKYKETTLGKLYFKTIKSHRKLTIYEKIKFFLWSIYENLEILEKKRPNR